MGDGVLFANLLFLQRFYRNLLILFLTRCYYGHYYGIIMLCALYFSLKKLYS